MQGEVSSPEARLPAALPVTRDRGTPESRNVRRKLGSQGSVDLYRNHKILKLRIFVASDAMLAAQEDPAWAAGLRPPGPGLGRGSTQLRHQPADGDGETRPGPTPTPQPHHGRNLPPRGKVLGFCPLPQTTQLRTNFRNGPHFIRLYDQKMNQ